MVTLHEQKATLAAELEELELQEFKLLQDLSSHKDRNLIYYFNRPNPKQALILDAWLRPTFKVFTFTGGNRMGKTTLGAILAWCTILGEFPWNKSKLIFPHNLPRKVRYIGQDWEKHIGTVVVPALKKWWPADRKVLTKKNNVGVEAYWTDVKSGGTLEIMSNKQESELHEGWDGDLIIYDEPPRREIRVANARGLVDRQGRELFCMTLLKESWIDREVIKAIDDTGKPDPTVFSVTGQIYDNVGYGLTLEGVQQFEKTLTPDEKEARLLGIPSYMSGLVYPTFSRQKHLKPRFPVPLNWIVDIAIDIHPRERQAVLFIATAPNGNRYLIDEIWENGDGTFVGEEIVRRINRNSYRIGRVIIDPLSKGDKNNENTVFDKVEAVLLSHSIILEVASKDKDAGILGVKSHLCGPAGEASIFIFDDLRRTIYEIEGYMWDEDTQKAAKVDDHMMENLYRLILLDTKYFDCSESDEDENTTRASRNSITGY